MKRKNKKGIRNFFSRRLIIAACVVLLVAAAVVVWAAHNSGNQKKTSQTVGQQLESKLGQQRADQKGSTPPPSSTNQTGSTPKNSPAPSGGSQTPSGGNITPVITFPTSGSSNSSSNLSVNAFVGVLDSGGTCTLELTSGARTLPSITSSTIENGQETSCRPLDIPNNELTAGSWTAVVTYKSPAYNGASQPVTFTVY